MRRVFLRSLANPDSEWNPARLSTLLNLHSDMASCKFTVAVWLGHVTNIEWKNKIAKHRLSIGILPGHVERSATEHRKCAELKQAKSELCIGATKWKNSSLLAVNLIDLLAEMENIEHFVRCPP